MPDHTSAFIGFGPRKFRPTYLQRDNGDAGRRDQPRDWHQDKHVEHSRDAPEVRSGFDRVADAYTDQRRIQNSGGIEIADHVEQTPT